MVLCYHVAAIRKELSNQNRLLSALFGKLESNNNLNIRSQTSEEMLFQLSVYDSKNRKFLFRNINTNNYEQLPALAQYAVPMSSQKSDIQLEIILQNGLTNVMKNVPLSLKSKADNYIDIADFVA